MLVLSEFGKWGARHQHKAIEQITVQIWLICVITSKDSTDRLIGHLVSTPLVMTKHTSRPPVNHTKQIRLKIDIENATQRKEFISEQRFAIESGMNHYGTDSEC